MERKYFGEFISLHLNHEYLLSNDSFLLWPHGTFWLVDKTSSRVKGHMKQEVGEMSQIPTWVIFSIYGYNINHTSDTFILITDDMLIGKAQIVQIILWVMVNLTTNGSTLPRQWSLITISQDNHSFHPMFPTDHCRLVSIFRRKVRWRSEHVYTRITDICRLT